MERDDPFYIQSERVADSGNDCSGFGVFAVLDSGDYLITRTGSEYQFSEVWRKGHQPGHRSCKAQGGTISLLEPDLCRRGEWEADEQPQDAEEPLVQTMTPISRSRASTVNQTPSIRQARSIACCRQIIGPSIWSA